MRLLRKRIRLFKYYKDIKKFNVEKTIQTG